VESITSLQAARHHFSALNEETDLPISSAYQLKPQSNKWLTYPSASPHRY
jgi:hypothetical protein